MSNHKDISILNELLNSEELNFIVNKYSFALDKEDAIQYAVEVALYAIQVFNQQKNVALKSFLLVCIDRFLSKIASKQHNVNLKEAINIDNSVEYSLSCGSNNNDYEYIEIKEIIEQFDTLASKAKLTQNEKNVIKLFLKDYTIYEIAKKLNKSPDNIKTTKSRAIKKLQKIFSNM